METRYKINPVTINFLDERLQKALFPFRCFQHMVFLSSFSIEYNCIRPHRTSYYIVSLIGVLVFIGFHIVNFIILDIGEVSPTIWICFRINILLVLVPLAFFYVLNVLQREDHVRLILEIQKAFRLINFKQYNIPIRRNWLIIFRHGIAYIVSIALTRNWLMVFYFYILLYFDALLTYGAVILGLIRDGVVAWTSEVEYYSKIYWELEEKKSNDQLTKCFQSYSNLLEAYDIFKKIFKFRILCQTFNTFFQSLLYLKVTLEVLSTDVKNFNNDENHAFEIITVLMTVKNITFVTIFNYYCEKFYLAVIEVDAVCSRLLKSPQSTVEAKKLYKNVQRLNRAAFHKMTACRIFIIDGRLPLKFNGLVIEYIFVILQFAFESWKNKSITL